MCIRDRDETAAAATAAAESSSIDKEGSGENASTPGGGEVNEGGTEPVSEKGIGFGEPETGSVSHRSHRTRSGRR